MVRIRGGRFQWGSTEAVDLPDFLMDKYEVTNREFKKFVESGGYKKPEDWKEPFVRGGQVLSFDEALKGFLDRTGRPGPATCQMPLFRSLGTPAKDKRIVLFDAGHIVPRNEVIKETLDWLDRYLGPAK